MSRLILDSFVLPYDNGSGEPMNSQMVSLHTLKLQPFPEKSQRAAFSGIGSLVPL